MRTRLVDANALYNGAMKEEYFGFKAHDEDGRESFAYSCAMQRLAEAPTIPAIPVDWIRKYADTVGSRVRAEIVREMLDMWAKEREER